MSAQSGCQAACHQLLLLSMDTSSMPGPVLGHGDITVTLRPRSCWGQRPRICWGQRDNHQGLLASANGSSPSTVSRPLGSSSVAPQAVPRPTLPWQSSTSADMQSRPRHRKVTEKSMWRRATAPSGIHEVSNGIRTGKETQIPSIQDTDCSHNFGPKKSLLGHLCRST